MRNNSYRLSEIEQKLNALASALEAKFLIPTYPVVTDSERWQRKHKRELEISEYLIQAGRLLLEGYKLGGFQSLPRARNALSTLRAECEKNDWRHVRLFEVVVSPIPRYALEPYHWSWDASREGWIAAAMRFLAMELTAPPVDKAVYLQQKQQRRDRYRLPKEARVVPSPYIVERPANYEYHSWGRALREPEQVERLRLSRKRAKRINADIEHLYNLRVLTLENHYQMSKLPDEIGNLQQLRALNLTWIGLQTLTTNIGKLDKLEILSIVGGKLETLPEEIGQLTNLQELNLGHNKLSTLPRSIGYLRQLCVLNLWGNVFVELPEHIGKLEALETLNLWNNRLKTLPKSFTRLQNLQRLDLMENDFDHFPGQVLAELPSLQELSWGRKGNVQTTLPDGIQRLRSLRCLVLRGKHAKEDVARLQAQCPLLEIRTW